MLTLLLFFSEVRNLNFCLKSLDLTDNYFNLKQSEPNRTCVQAGQAQELSACSLLRSKASPHRGRKAPSLHPPPHAPAGRTLRSVQESLAHLQQGTRLPGQLRRHPSLFSSRRTRAHAVAKPVFRCCPVLGGIQSWGWAGLEASLKWARRQDSGGLLVFSLLLGGWETQLESPGTVVILPHSVLACIY